MLTAAERRHLVLAIGDGPLSDPRARRVVKTARAIIEGNLGKIAAFFNYRTESVAHGPATPVIPLIKPVGDRCNLRCRYCFNKPSSLSEPMTDDVLEGIIGQVLHLNPGAAHVIFHGGEPLLAGIKFFEKAISFEEKHRRPSQEVLNSVTTNGTLLNREWAEFFSKHKFGVTISIDGPQPAHDKNRVDPSGRGTFERVLKGIDSVRAAGCNLGVISVIPAEPVVNGKELFDLVTSFGVREWRINPCRSPQPNHYAEYVADLFDTWSTAQEEVQIAIIDETFRGQMGYSPKTCWMKGSCKKCIGFEPHGVVSPCCEMSLDPSFHFGNIGHSPLEKILHSAEARKFWADRNEGIRVYCAECTWTHLCAGGCTYHRIQNSASPRGKDYLCETYKETFLQLTARIDSILLSEGSKVN